MRLDIFNLSDIVEVGSVEGVVARSTPATRIDTRDESAGYIISAKLLDNNQAYRIIYHGPDKEALNKLRNEINGRRVKVSLGEWRKEMSEVTGNKVYIPLSDFEVLG